MNVKKDLNISKFHNNKKPHNWLVYNIGDKFLLEYSKYYKGTLVDLGCGTAPYKEFFLQFADEYIGVDWTNTRHASKADVVSNLNEKIELDDNYADTIVSLSVMEHLCEPQIFLNESYRILKTGGTMVLQVPWQWWIHEAPYDYFRYTPYGLKYLFNKAGFTDVFVQPATGFFTMWFTKWNYFTMRLVKGSRFKKSILNILFRPQWFFLQKTAPFLDRLDKNWSLESQGYYVIAKK